MQAVGAGWRIYGIGPVYRVDVKARACPSVVPPVPSFHLFPLDASLLVRASPSTTPSDASCSADQRDFCLKHDLSLKYLKPDYLWVCHLGRRDITPDSGRILHSSLSLFFFAKSDAPMQVKSHAFEFSLRTWNFLSCPLPASPCSTPFCPLSSMKGIP